MDPWRKLQVVNAANPSLRLSVAPPNAQQSAPLRVAQSRPAQQIRMQPGTPRYSAPAPEPVISRPKQSFWNKARDVLDANTEADKYRRQQGNMEKVRIGGVEAAGQKPIVSENPGNIITNTIGAIPRTFNTAANQIVEVGYTAQQQFATSEYSKAVQELLAAQKSGDKARYDLAKVRADNASQRVSNINDLIKATKSNYKENSGGLFNVGTMYNEQDSYEGKLSTGLRKIGGNTVEGMFDVASLGLTGVAAKQVAKQGIKQTLKTSGGIIAKNAALNTGQGAASSFRQGGDLKDVAITAAASGTIGSVADVALAGVGGSLLKQVGKARAGAITKQLSDYFVAETNETAIKTMLGNNLNVPANKIDSIAKYVAKENNPKAINKLVQELSIDPNLELTPDVINQLRDGGITAVRRDKDAQYQAQYKDGVITARGQKELDDHVYHELGHHLYNTRLTPEEKALFTGQGNASKQAVGRPGYTQDNVNAEDFADYLNMASRGRINDVPKEYQAIIRKYAKIAEAQSNDVISTGRVKSVANKELVNQGLTGSRVTRRKLTDLTLGSDALGDVDPAQVADYTNRIRLGENIDPVIVTRGSDGQYYVVDGKHRLEAMKQLGITDVPTVEVPGKNSGITNADIIAAKQGVGDIQDATAKATGETVEPPVATAGTPSIAAQVSSDQATVTKQVSDKATEIYYRNGELDGENVFLSSDKKVADSYAFDKKSGERIDRTTGAFTVSPNANIRQATTKLDLLKELGYNQKDKFNRLTNVAPDGELAQERIIKKALKEQGFDGVKYSGYDEARAKLVGNADETGELQLFDKKFLVEADAPQAGKTAGDAFGTTDKYVYHADATNAPVDKFAKEGIKPSTRGQAGAGVYLANTMDATEYNYSSKLGEVPTMYRVDKQALIDKYGLYPSNKNGVQFDETTGEILLDGKRNIPPEFIEVKQGDGWNPLVSKTADEVAAKNLAGAKAGLVDPEIAVRFEQLLKDAGFDDTANPVEVAYYIDSVLRATDPEFHKRVATRAGISGFPGAYKEETPTQAFIREQIMYLRPGSDPVVKLNAMTDAQLDAKTPPASILKKQPEVDPNFNPTPRQAGFAQSLSQTSTPKAVYDDLLEITTKPNPQTFAQASQDIVANEQGILKDILGKSKDSLNDVDNARALLLLDKAIADDNIPLATQLASKINRSATENARAVQILSAIDKTTPAGAFKEAQKIVTEAQEKKLLPENYTIPPEKLASINERAKFIQTLEMGTREHDIAVGELLADLKSIVPVTVGDKLNSIVNISLLLNPKTFIRNVIGNTAGNVAETVSTAVSTPIDMLVSLRTGKRSVALPSVIERLGGFGQGLKEGFEETNKGIRLGIGGNSKYDINTPVFENRVGQWMEKALGHSLSDLDKAFATSQMRDTINSLMKATGAKKPTQEMIDIAGHEALYATYQGDSFIAKSLMGLKGWLNKANIKGFGLGDVVVRYPKTPGNLVAVGMDYSPYGFAKGLVQFVQLNKGTSLAAQREAVRNLGRGITGTGLIAGGYYLAQNNIITAKKSSDKDLNSLQRQQGQPPFSFNITALGRLMRGEDTKAREGDVVSTYDWLQPNAIQLSMGANMALNKDKGSTDAISTILDQAATGLETIEEQPVLAQTGRFFKTAMTPADQGGGIPNAIVDSVSGLPSMFVPSVVNQTAASMDNTARTTYDPNPVKQGLNKVIGKLPFANKTLQPAIDTFGNEIKRQQTDNPITRVFNSFVNPAFVTKIKRTPEGQMVLDIYNRSGETGQIPRLAARKQQVNLDGGDDSTASSYTLSGKELTEFQKLTGKLAEETFAELANNPTFMALPDEQKAAEMQKRLTEINSYAKITVLGNKPKTMTDGVKALLNGRVGDFASKSPENVTGLAKQYYDKTAYMDDATYKEWLNGAPDEVATATAKELNKARPQYTNELQAYNGLTKRYAEYQKSIADAKKEGSWTKLDEVEKDQEFWKGAIKDGRDDLTRDIYDAGSSGSKDYWEKGYISKEDIDKAIALDDELYASGLTKSLKFSKTFRKQYGYGIPQSADDIKKGTSGGSGGGKKAKLKTVQGLNELKLRFSPTAAPDVSAVPRTASKRLKFDVPSAVQVKPVRLKL